MSRSERLPGTLRALPGRAARIRSDLFFAGQDAVLVVVSFGCILLVRYGGQVPREAFEDYVRFLLLAVVVYLTSHNRAGLYGEIWRFASVLEARRLLLSGGVAFGVLLLIDLAGVRLVPQSVLVAGCLFTTMLVGTVRFGSRLFSSRRRDDGLGGLRVVIVGAGETGAALVREMLGNRRSGLVPVALLDDDPRKHGRTILGVRVLGSIGDLSVICAATDAHQVVLAIPTARRDLVQQIAKTAHNVDVVLRVIPESYDPVLGPLRLSDMRDLTIEDLLGRKEVVTDLDAVRALLSDRRVLVTGAGGSIGSEIVRQVAAFSPSQLVLLDHDETHLHDACEVLTTSPGGLAGCTPILALADIRDRAQISGLFRLHQPEVVFHAAAHKHVPLLESHASEAARTNVIGTSHVLAAARAAGVDSFVFISTDKAVRPASVMGASKHLAEQLVLTSGTRSGGTYCAVRFGNVLGSRGSVIPTFARQIEAGGPVTVTDPRMTRYFMSTQEAVQLVLQAASMARGGEVFMLEMGEPIGILELAKRMIRMSGRRVGEDIELRIVGPRPGEKLEEQLRLPEELPQTTEHAAVVRLRPTTRPPEVLDEVLEELRILCAGPDDGAIRSLLMSLAGGPNSRIPAAVASSDVLDVRRDADLMPAATPTGEPV